MGFGPFSSDSKASQSAVTGTDNAIVISGGKRAVVGAAGAITQGAGATFLEPNAAQFQNVRGTINYSSSDPEVVQAALAANLASETDLVNAIKDAQAASGNVVAGGQDAIANALGKLGDLLQSQQTGGQTSLLKPLVILGVAALVVLGFVFWTTKK